MTKAVDQALYTQAKGLSEKPVESLLEHKQSEYDDFSHNEHMDRGWSWVILAACFFSNCVVGCTVFAIGITHVVLLERFGQSVAITSWASALHSVLNTLAAPAASFLIDRYSCRVTIVIAGVCYVTGFIMTAFAPFVEVAIVTFGVVAGMGGGLTYTTTMVAIRVNFDRHKNICMGVASAGIGVGMLVFAPAMQLARDYYGTSGFFIIMAAITANVITCGMLYFPSKLEISLQRRRKLEALQSTQKTCANLGQYKTVVLNKGVALLCAEMSACLLGQYLVLIYLPSYARAKGISATNVSYLVSFAGILSIVGRISTGVLANIRYFSNIGLCVGSLVIVGIAAMAYPLVSSHIAGHIAFVLAFGLTHGSPFVLQANVSLKFVDMKYLAAAIGIQLFAGGLGGLIGTVMAGVLVDYTGTYDIPMHIAGALSFMAGGFVLLSVCFKRVTKETIVINVEEET